MSQVLESPQAPMTAAQPIRSVCIIGAGAIGGWMAAKLLAHGHPNLSLLARGQTLAALRHEGLRFLSGDGQTTAWPVRASADAAELGPQDLVIIAVKGQALPTLAPSLAPLMHANTLVMPAINGVPWWFCEGLSHLSPALAAPLNSVDPEGNLGQHLPLARIIGCVVHASAASPSPGLVHHRAGNGLVIGEATHDGSQAPTPRLRSVESLLRQAGFDVTVSAHVRYDIWYKLWGNLTMNPASVLTRATMDQMLADPLVRALCTRAMLEAGVIGERLGCPIAQTPEDRHVITAKLGAVRTSMLQDMEAGRELELNGIVASVREIGERLGVPTPTIDALHGLARVAAAARPSSAPSA